MKKIVVNKDGKNDIKGMLWGKPHIFNLNISLFSSLSQTKTKTKKW